MKLLMESWRKYLTEAETFSPGKWEFTAPGRFKAFFMAGGSGTGKSVVLEKLNLNAHGIQLVDPDEAFEKFLHEAGMELKLNFDEMPRADKIAACHFFNQSQKWARGERDQLVVERKGLVIDGTGGMYGKINKPNQDIKSLGYDTAMIFVYADWETVERRSQGRGEEGGRQLDLEKTERSYKAVMKNLERYEQNFKENFFFIDVSGDEHNDEVRGKIDEQIDAVRDRIVKFINTPPKNKMAHEWIKCSKQDVLPYNEDEEEPVQEQTEPFQQALKKGSVRKKIRVIGLGGNKTKAKPYVKNPSMKRSKSAPPGFGGS